MEMTGNSYLIDFGMAKAKFTFQSETSLTFTITEKDGIEADIRETVTIETTGLRPRLYLVTWQEQNGNTITQVQDYEKGVIYSNWTTPGGEFTHANGTITRIST